ncbi:MAG: OmpA family protein, partial [Firmicutes bacterium]|nr:OmpA family protein [Bacillota bacterium]
SIITGMSGVHANGTATQEDRQLNALQNQLQQALDKAGLGAQASVTSNPRGVELSVNASLLFPSASATLSPSAVDLLQQVGSALKSVPNDVEVIGYTDATPIHTAQYPSNWQLSADRAANVVYTLAQVPGINPSRLSLAGFGKFHPIATNATAAGRRLNRRVNILVLRHSVAQVAIGNGP